MSPASPWQEPTTYDDEKTIVDPIEEATSPDTWREPSQTTASTRVAAEPPPAAALWVHVDALARARVGVLESLIAEAMSTDADAPAIAYAARFAVRMGDVLDALRSFSAHACEPRTAPLFATDATASRALQRLYGWCGAELAQFEDLARDPDVMHGRASACDRTRAEESALHLLAFVEPSLAALRCEVGALLTATRAPHVIGDDLEAVDAALGALARELRRGVDRAAVSNVVPCAAPVVSELAASVAPPPARSSVAKWSVLGMVVAMCVLAGALAIAAAVTG